jgi:hypothetical protein
MNLGQRWAYLSGGLQWYGDLVALLFFLFLLVGAANVAFGSGLLFRKLTGFLFAAIPMLVILGFVRAVALLRRGTGASWRDAFGAFMIWQSTGLVVARASVQGLYAREAEFLRTPKTAEDAKWWHAIRGNAVETAAATIGAAGIAAAIAAAITNNGGAAALLTAGLLLWPTAAYAGAPFNSLSAQRAALPPELRARRLTEHQRYRVARRVTYAAAALALVGGAAALAVVLLSPGNKPVVTPQLVAPAQGHNVQAPPGGTTPSGPQPSGSSGSSGGGSSSNGSTGTGSTSGGSGTTGPGGTGPGGAGGTGPGGAGGTGPGGAGGTGSTSTGPGTSGSTGTGPGSSGSSSPSPAPAPPTSTSPPPTSTSPPPTPTPTTSATGQTASSPSASSSP